MTPRKPPYTCADCGRGFFDMATGKHPVSIREKVREKERVTLTKHDGFHLIVTTVYRAVEPVLGTGWMPGYPESTRQVSLCRYCGWKRGYTEGTDAPLDPPDADPPTTPEEDALARKVHAHPRSIHGSVRKSVRNSKNPE